MLVRRASYAATFANSVVTYPIPTAIAFTIAFTITTATTNPTIATTAGTSTFALGTTPQLTDLGSCSSALPLAVASTNSPPNRGTAAATFPARPAALLLAVQHA